MNHLHQASQPTLSPEDILIVLDQLDQTVEVMAAVIKRLKRELAHVLPAIDQPTSPPQDIATLVDLPVPENGWH